MDDLSIWSPVEIAVGQCVSWDFGPLSVWAEHYELEWHILPDYHSGGGGAYPSPAFGHRNKTEKPDSTGWRHYLLKEGNWAVPAPAMVDRPVVLRPDRALILMPGEKARFFISLPVWFRIMVGRTPAEAQKPSFGNKRTLCEFPIQPMPNAWFGDPVSGELCYFSASRLYPEYSQVPVSPFHAVCSLRVSNESDTDLPFDRICLHTEFLGIFRSSQRLLTNEVLVVFRGADSETLIQPSKGAPPVDGSAKLLTGPRQVMENRYFKKTFGILKYFSGF